MKKPAREAGSTSASIALVTRCPRKVFSDRPTKPELDLPSPFVPLAAAKNAQLATTVAGRITAHNKLRQVDPRHAAHADRQTGRQTDRQKDRQTASK